MSKSRLACLKVECPQCGAKAGEGCRSYTGLIFEYVAHMKRKELAARRIA